MVVRSCHHHGTPLDLDPSPDNGRVATGSQLAAVDGDEEISPPGADARTLVIRSREDIEIAAQPPRHRLLTEPLRIRTGGPRPDFLDTPCEQA
jgi:hypothetical protein